MDLNQKAALKAGGIGAGIATVIALIVNIGTATAPAVFGFVAIFCCCFNLLIYAGIGALYGVFARQEGAEIDTGPTALGGAISAAAASVVGAIIGGIVSIIAALTGSAPTVADIYSAEQMQQLSELGFDPSILATATSPGGAVLSALLSICIGLFIGAALGAIGGAIYGATQKDSSPPPAAEAPTE